MSLITRFRGDVKSGKTLSAVYWTKRLMVETGCSVYTNMSGCIYRGTPWAETIKLNDLLADMQDPNLENARFKLGILLLDEAHIYWDTNNMRGQAGNLLTAFIAQAGKRGLIIVYTSHLAGMVHPRVRQLTQLDIKCKTSNEGVSVLWDVIDSRDVHEAVDEGRAAPDPYFHVLHQGYRQFEWYDTNEPIDPFSFAASLGASKSAKKLMKDLEKLASGEQEDNSIAVQVERRKALEDSALAAANMTLPEARASRGSTKRKRLVAPRQGVFGGAR